MTSYYLNEGLPRPKPSPLDAPFWEGLQNNMLKLQYCQSCGSWQWGPEWICHKCISLDLTWDTVEATGVIYSWERPWHPVHPALKDHGPYLVVLVELPHAGNVRMIGNLLGDPHQQVVIGSKVEAVFEPHDDAAPAYTLVQWKVVD